MTQRGGGRSDALTERLSVYITDAKLPEKAAGEDRFESVPTVTAARAKHELLLLYLVDSSAEEPKREAFESVMFGSEELAVALRCFHLVRIDIAADAEAKVKYGRRLPVFLPSDENGKSSGDIALTGYKAAITGLISLLEKSASGHVKPTLSTFISDYRGVVHDLSVIELQRKAMKDRIARLTDEKKKPAWRRMPRCWIRKNRNCSGRSGISSNVRRSCRAMQTQKVRPKARPVSATVALHKTTPVATLACRELHFPRNETSAAIAAAAATRRGAEEDQLCSAVGLHLEHRRHAAKEVQLLDDVTVDISGFMMREIPGSGPVNTFLLINDACGCNGTPKMNEIVFCALAEGVTMDVKPGIVHVIGKLFVGEQKEDGEVIALYSMDADSVQ